MEQALFHEPQNSLYLSELGENYSSLGNLYQAVECYRRAVVLAPYELSLKGRLGRAYLSIDDFERAFQSFAEIRKADSTNVFFNKQYAFAAFRLGKVDMAIRIYEQVVSENPGDFSSHLNLIAIYKRKKDAAKVYESGNRALSVFPSNATLLLRQADALYELKDYERALFPYEKYLAVNDSTFDVLKNYGITLFFCKQEQEAIRVLEKCFLQKAFELNNKKVEVLFEIATTYEEFNFNKTLALNYYNTYLKTAREKAQNADYALERIRKIKEELFFENK